MEKSKGITGLRKNVSFDNVYESKMRDAQYNVNTLGLTCVMHAVYFVFMFLF